MQDTMYQRGLTICMKSKYLLVNWWSLLSQVYSKEWYNAIRWGQQRSVTELQRGRSAHGLSHPGDFQVRPQLCIHTTSYVTCFRLGLLLFWNASVFSAWRHKFYLYILLYKLYGKKNVIFGLVQSILFVNARSGARVSRICGRTIGAKL